MEESKTEMVNSLRVPLDTGIVEIYGRQNGNVTNSLTKTR